MYCTWSAGERQVCSVNESELVGKTYYDPFIQYNTEMNLVE